MFGEMFDDADDQQAAVEAEALGALPKYYQTRAPHCAYDLDMPP